MGGRGPDMWMQIVAVSALAVLFVSRLTWTLTRARRQPRRGVTRPDS